MLVGVDQGWKATGEMSYGGPGCVERARRAEEIVRKRLEPLADEIDELRIDLQGVNSLFGDRMPGGYPSEVRLRLAVRTTSLEVARDGRPRDRAALLRPGRWRRQRDVRRAGARGHPGLRAARAGRPSSTEV